jgi:hypothetical protein
LNNPYEQNPFEILRLDPAVTTDQVVAQAGRLRQRAVGEDEWTAIRRAVQALTGTGEDRTLASLFTHPRPCYHWPASDQLAAAFRRPPNLPNSTESSLLGEKTALADVLRSGIAEQEDAEGWSLAGKGQAEADEETWTQGAAVAWQRLGASLGI